MEAVRNMMRTVVGLVLMEEVPRSTYKVTQLKTVPRQAMMAAAVPPTKNWYSENIPEDERTDD